MAKNLGTQLQGSQEVLEFIVTLLTRILDNISLFIEYMNTDLSISTSLQILTVFLVLNFSLCLPGYKRWVIGGDDSCWREIQICSNSGNVSI